MHLRRLRRFISQEADGQKLVLTLESIESDGVKDDVFDLPAAIVAQLAPRRTEAGVARAASEPANSCQV